ncbi:kinase-like domain-containing protein [Mycena alexandri]|uniref:Kinase-like domain-containing protein n=1 Tax=Mycena alexandri TaxID=1745969 RepID=A0AAD6X177_9AGAR|nr:kinase-like domain-containing protein [Mycena alexandri]
MLILLRLIVCVSSLAARTNDVRCRVLSSVERAIDSVGVGVVWILKRSSHGNRPLPPPPTKTFPLLIPPTHTFVTEHRTPSALWAILIPLVAAAVIALAATAAKMGVVKGARKGVYKVLGSLFYVARNVVFVVIVCGPLSLGGDILKVYRYKAPLAIHLRVRNRRNGVKRYELLLIRLHACDAAVAAVCNVYRRILLNSGLANLVWLVSLTGYDVTTLLDGLHALYPATSYGPVPYQPLPKTSFLAHPDIPFYDVARMLKTALPGPYVYMDPDPGSRWDFLDCRTWETVPALEGFFPDRRVDPLSLRKVGELGAGGFGTVIKVRVVGRDAQQMVGSKFLAVKRIERPRNNERDRWKAIISEVVTHRLLEYDPAFPRLHGAFENRKFCFLVMDCGKFSLASASPTDRYSAWSYSTQLAQAVHSLHRTGAVHFDLKPENLIVNVHGKLQIIDYGLVHLFDDDEVDGAEWPEWAALRDAEPRTDAFPVLWPGEDNPHATSAPGGTHEYMCPEAEMGLPCCYAADLWAMGIIMYEWYAHASPAFQGYLWEPVSAHDLSAVELDFFSKIFSDERPLRFEDWGEIHAHPIWSSEGEVDNREEQSEEEDDSESDAEDDDGPSC